MVFVRFYIYIAITTCLYATVSCHKFPGDRNVFNIENWKIPKGTWHNDFAYIRKRHKYPHLLAFVRKDCEFCQDMEPLIKQLEKDYDVQVEVLDVSSNQNYSLMTKLDKKTKCNGLPFFYNLISHQHICGATTYQNLVLWATGRRCRPILPSPLKSEEIKASYRKTGLYARIMSKLGEVLLRGERKMIDRLNHV